jgi:phospholipid/cholesterol/gamma-HCH transport system ATP-binding protein
MADRARPASSPSLPAPSLPDEKKDRGEMILRVRGLGTMYGDRRVLKDINFDLAKGEILAIIGGSGGGKSTLLKLLIGLKEPSEGEIVYWGENLPDMDEDEFVAFLERIGVAFQSGGLFNSLTLGENVAMPLRERGGMDEATIRELVEMKLEMVGLADFQHLMPSELSGGMKKRAGFARALALDPELVFFDEPSSGLDPIIAAGLDELILKLTRALGLTMVIVTHEMPSVKLVADRVLMLDQGEAIFSGSLKEALQTSISRTRQFFDRQPDASISTRGADAS